MSCTIHWIVAYRTTCASKADPETLRNAFLWLRPAFEEGHFYFQAHEGNAQAVISFPVVDAVAQPLAFLKLVLHVLRAADVLSPPRVDEKTRRRNSERELTGKVWQRIDDMKQLWINHVHDGPSDTATSNTDDELPDSEGSGTLISRNVESEDASWQNLSA